MHMHSPSQTAKFRSKFNSLSADACTKKNSLSHRHETSFKSTSIKYLSIPIKYLRHFPLNFIISLHSCIFTRKLRMENLFLRPPLATATGWLYKYSINIKLLIHSRSNRNYLTLDHKNGEKSEFPARSLSPIKFHCEMCLKTLGEIALRRPIFISRMRDKKELFFRSLPNGL